MTIAKKLGVWMDHSIAHLMEFTTDPIQTKTIESRFTRQEHAYSLAKCETLVYLQEQKKRSAYYMQLVEIIKNYKEVILFGPTYAKVDLYNALRADTRLIKTKIEIRQTEKMSENQLHAFVKQHFSRKGGITF
ncbi:hypothetical protein [Parasediminibacterium sp. JCM 36343]|uniref:hypothetical protein n=1 Tax=Parasediminibacterium sp. JCM 36343 TaxID=3374279 RepID=UPI003979DBF1